MFGSFALTAAVFANVAKSGASPRTFGTGIPNHPFTTKEVEIFGYNLTAGDKIGVVNHL